MTNLQNLIDEITSLEIKISEGEYIYSLEHYSQAENQLRQLNSRALTEIINLTDEQIKRQIKRLETEHSKLNRLKTYFNEQYKIYFQGTGFDADEFINLLSRYLIISFPERKLNNVITNDFMYCLLDAITFKAAYLIGFINTVKEQTKNSEPQAITPPPAETPADKIRATLEQLRGAFADSSHIDKIIEGFVSYKVEGKQPSPNKAVLDMLPIEFIKPFRIIQDKKILKQWEICDLLLYFIEKSTPENREYSPAYILKLLGNSKAKI